MGLHYLLEPKRDVLSKYFDLEKPSPAQLARLDTLALFEILHQEYNTDGAVLFGGQAVITHIPGLRDTVDIDLAACNGSVRGAMNALGYFSIPEPNPDMIKEKYEKRVGDGKIELDVFLPGKTVLGGTLVDKEMFTKSQIIDNFGTPLNVANIVDLIATKINTGRKKDCVDIYNLIKNGKEKIDSKYFQERLGANHKRLLAVPQKIEEVVSRPDAKVYREYINQLYSRA